MVIDSSILEKADPAWLAGPEGSMSVWGTLPHGIIGATPAGPAVRHKKKRTASRKEGPARPRRRNQPVPSAELESALAVRPGSLIPHLTYGSNAEVRRRPRGRTKRAGFIDDPMLERIKDYLRANSRSLASDNVKLMLSFKAGLRAGEIAQIAVANFLEAGGEVGDEFWVSPTISKSHRGRTIPINLQLKEALIELRRCHPDATHVAFSVGSGGRLRRQNAAAVTTWFHHLYRRVGLQGASSHSGRRTFATKMSRIAGGNRASLADIQKLMGHARLASTECYLEHTENVRSLVHAI